MSVLILVLFVGLFLHDALIVSGGDVNAAFPLIDLTSGAWMAVAVIVPKVLIALVYHWLSRRALASLNQTHETKSLRRLEKWTAKLRQLLVISYISDLVVFGALNYLREVALGDLILVDELLIMLPPLAVTFCMWLSHYPVDLRLREATFMSRMERGLPVQMWTRGQYLLAQFRHQWALMGIPLLLLSGWSETVQYFFKDSLSQGMQASLLLGGSLTVFMFTPLIIRHIWDTIPLPAGEMRDRLVAMCQQHRVGIRELLLWRTYGGMINGAVMGFVRPLRYILLTDALLETMPAKQVEAVMAHELAHVRKHHMFWMLIVAACSMELLRILIVLGLQSLSSLMRVEPLSSLTSDTMRAIATHRDFVSLAPTIVSIIGWFYIFGWVSRRFERQADTFAAQHLAREWHEAHPTGIDHELASATTIAPLPPTTEMIAALERGESPQSAALPAQASASVLTHPGTFPRAATESMAGALQSVADLNYIPTQRPSWRHGSIAWRQRYLRSLPGTPIEGTSIDHQVKRIKWGGVVIILILVAIHMLM